MVKEKVKVIENKTTQSIHTDLTLARDLKKKETISKTIGNLTQNM